MTTGIKAYSITAASNNATPPNGWPEGMAISDVNNAARQMMAEIRKWYEVVEWIDYGHAGLAYFTSTSFKVTGDLTSIYVPNRRIRAIGTTPFEIYGTITTSAYSSPDTTVTIVWDSGSLDNTLSEVALGSNPTNQSISAFSIKGNPPFVYSGELTIASGAITRTGIYHTVDTESDAASDDLETINGGIDGQLLIIRTSDNARDVVIKNSGNIQTPNAIDIPLKTSAETITLVYDGSLSKWIVQSSNYDLANFSAFGRTLVDDADAAAARTTLGLSGTVLQVVNTQTGAVATGTAQIPYDDTVPQITEGTEFMTLAITPKLSTSKLKIDVVFNFSQTGSGTTCTAALFRDSTAGSVGCAGFSVPSGSGGILEQIKFTVWLDSSSVSSTTFSLRAGSSGSETTTFNGTGGARRYGGVMSSSITITEVAA